MLQELSRQASWSAEPVHVFHVRARDAFEVDIVMERGHSAVVGVDVKAAASVNEFDFRGLRQLRASAGKDFMAGVVLYDGTVTLSFGDGRLAAPLRSLWEPAWASLPPVIARR